MNQTTSLLKSKIRSQVKPTNQTRGFTILEMLIVLTILAIAAGALRFGFDDNGPVQTTSSEQEAVNVLSSRAILTVETQTLRIEHKQEGEFVSNGVVVRTDQQLYGSEFLFAPDGGIYARE